MSQQPREKTCPRCKARVTLAANAEGIVVCSGCGARLIVRSASPPPAGETKSAAGPVITAVKPPPAQQPHAESRPAQPVSDARPAAADPGPVLEHLLAEMRVLRASQKAMADVLKRIEQAIVRPQAAGAASAVAALPDDDEEPALQPIRTRRSKTLLLVDDDAHTREAVVRELQQSEVPVRAFSDCNSALAAIAEEQPDVIAIELNIGGDTTGADLINMIKATMEWVHIPIVLWTRVQVAGQRDARQVHGADELVLKSAGAQALVARVITLFRR